MLFYGQEMRQSVQNFWQLVDFRVSPSVCFLPHSFCLQLHYQTWQFIKSQNVTLNSVTIGWQGLMYFTSDSLFGLSSDILWRPKTAGIMPRIWNSIQVQLKTKCDFAMRFWLMKKLVRQWLSERAEKETQNTKQNKTSNYLEMDRCLMVA